MATLFKSIEVKQPRLNYFDLSHSDKLTCNMGQLIPVYLQECVSGDKFNISAEITVRAMPMIAPILHDVNIYTHYFYVPYRILWHSWEKFFTRANKWSVDSEHTLVPPKFSLGSNGQTAREAFGTGSLWDYFGFPTELGDKDQLPTAEYRPSAFPWLAYNLIYDEFYRNQWYQTKVTHYKSQEDEDDHKIDVTEINGKVLNRNWDKDYFVGALPFAQAGTPPAFPISGQLPVSASSSDWLLDSINHLNNSMAPDGAGKWQYFTDGTRDHKHVPNPDVVTADMSKAVSFDINDFRRVAGIQRWQELNARAGLRYPEFMVSHFGVPVPDSRIQRPEYIGGTRQPLIISEVLQTSESSATPQGNLAGHGISFDDEYVGSYSCCENGLIIGIMSIMPRPAYCQGISREWTREDITDFYFDEFVGFGERAVENREIYAQFNATDKETFGFQGMYDEMRQRRSMVCGDMRNSLDYWTLFRKFGSLPTLSDEFLECDSTRDELSRAFAVQQIPVDPDNPEGEKKAAPNFVVNFTNKVKAYRPIPAMAVPGLGVI